MKLITMHNVWYTFLKTVTIVSLRGSVLLQIKADAFFETSLVV